MGDQQQEDEDDDSEVIVDSIIPEHEEWKKLILECWKLKNIDIQTFNEKWMEHPNKDRFMNWKYDSYAYSHGKTMLICAIYYGRLDIAKLLLEHGADINIATEFGKTALMYACEKGHTEMAGILLNKGVDPKITNKNGLTALMLASLNGRTDAVKLLLDKGAGMDISNKNGTTALIYATRNGYIEIIKLLLEEGADITISNKHGDTAWSLAMQRGCTEIVKLLVVNGADIKISNKHGDNVLIWALKKGHTDIAKLLLERGADTHITDEEGLTALMHALKRGHVDVVKLLLEKGADIHISDKRGWNALMYASRNGSNDLVKLLLDKCADIKMADKNGWTALMHASNEGHNDTVRLFLDKGADDSDIILLEWKKLIQNSSNGKIEKVAIETFQKWLEHPKKKRFIDWRDDNVGYGRTMLQRAILQKRLNIAKLLLEHGADYNIATKFGKTALMYASIGGHIEIVELLLDKGANLNFVNKYGTTALMYASEKGHTKIMEFLVDKGADLNIADNGGMTALIWALKGGHTKIVELLVHKGVDIHIPDNGGTTALMHASRGGHMDMVKLLMDKGADFSIANKGGKTALVYAYQGGYTEILQLLLDKGADELEIIPMEWNKLIMGSYAIENSWVGPIKQVAAETITRWLEHPEKERYINWKKDEIQYGRTMLQCAILHERLDIAKLLLEHGADTNIPDTNGCTASMHASYHGHTDIIELLVDKGADINIADNDGETTLIWALKGGHTDIIELLVNKGADLNITAYGGKTALIWALQGGHTKLVELLVNRGADLNIANDLGMTALVWAILDGGQTIAELLLDKGADINMTDHGGMTALIWAVMKGRHTDIMELLLDKGADINIADDGGETALISAIKGGQTGVVELLLDKGADLNIADNGGNTALMHACDKGHTEIVKLLLDKAADIDIANRDGETALTKASNYGHTEIVELLLERMRSQDIGSLFDAGVTIERLEELYLKEEVDNVVQALIAEQAEDGAKGSGRPAASASSTVEDGDEEHVQVPAIPDASKIERSRSQDIESLLDVGVTMEKLEELYPKEKVHRVVQACIVKQTEEEDEVQRRRRGSMARFLFLRSKSKSLREVLGSSVIMEQVLGSLLADPEEKILMCPLMLTRLKDPVVISSGFVMDRSTALDENGSLRMRLCPFSRKMLSLPVYPCIPIRSKLKAWEEKRMNRCIGVAAKMVESEEWDQASTVFDIAETLLEEMGDKTYLNHAAKLADLERKIPFVENDVERMVKIHQRLIRAAKGDKGETLKLLREAIKDCCRKFGGLMLSDDPVVLQECAKTRSAFSREVLSPTVLINNQAELRDEILELHAFDLALAKKLKSTATIWSFRRIILVLLETQSGNGDENSNANKTKISEFLKQEELTGNEQELSLDNYDSLRYWPQDKLVDTRIGLVRFDDPQNAGEGVETITSLSCNIDLNPRDGSDHWVEIAFRPFKLGYPSKFSIFSQHGPDTGWEILAGKEAYNGFHFVEAAWTTTNADGEVFHNEFFNRLVPVDPGQWYHVVLSFNSSTLELKLYVNGQPASKNVEGTFKPDSRFPIIGQNVDWPYRQFKGMVAYASGDTQFPVEYAEADVYVQSLFHGRLQKLRECSEAMVELDFSYYDSSEEESEEESDDSSEEESEEESDDSSEEESEVESGEFLLPSPSLPVIRGRIISQPIVYEAEIGWQRIM